MIRSLTKIEFVPAGGGAALVLLDYWDQMTDFPKFSWSQKDVSYAAAGAAWERGRSMGGAAHQGSWTRRVDHATVQAADYYVHTHPATMPINVQGKLKVSMRDAGSVEYKDARILACTPARLLSFEAGRVPTITEYRVALGEMVILSSATYTPPGVTPGDVPHVVPPPVTDEPSAPPRVLPPYGRVVGVQISGITAPAGLNGYYPMYSGREGDEWFFGDERLWLRRDYDTDPWRMFQRVPYPAIPASWYATTVTATPWGVTAWEAYDGAEGTPIIKPVYG